MIGYLFGEILENADGKILVGVGDRSSAGIIGYSVSVPQSASYAGFLIGQKIELFVYTHVREEAFDLYGFQNHLEKALFLTLLSVNGIGPKSALSILSSVDPSYLVEAIMQGDQAALTRVPGIGKKTAERVVVELRDNIKKKVEQGVFKSSSKDSKSRPGTGVGDREESDRLSSGELTLFQDAKAALVGLGYKEQDVHQLLKRVLQNQEVPMKRPEDLIRTALRQLA